MPESASLPMRAGRTFALLVTVLAVGAPIDAPAKIISLDERCRCADERRDHAQYVRCIKRNVKRYLRFEARFAPGAVRRRIPKAELRAAARARVAEAEASRCGMRQYLCDADRPYAAGETCDVRGCEQTVGVCVPIPESCPADGVPRCTCGTDEDPFGLTYANDCERIRAGAKLDDYGNSPYTQCTPSCGGPEGLTCPDGPSAATPTAPAAGTTSTGGAACRRWTRRPSCAAAMRPPIRRERPPGRQA
jgi:hypothetical protein